MEGIIGEKSEGFARTIIKDTWTITGGWIKTGEGGGEGWGAWRGLGGKGRKLYLNNNKIKKKKTRPLPYTIIVSFKSN